MSSSNSNIPWTRYWLPFGSTYTSDHLGFPSFRVDNFDSGKQTRYALTLNELSQIRCLILLGEPGSGKSTEVKSI